MIYWLEIIQLKMKSEKTCGNAFNTDWSRLPGVTRHTHTSDRDDLWTLICPLSWDAYGSGGDPRKEPEQAHVPVQLSGDLELGCGVGPPHGIPVDWKQRQRQNWRKKKPLDLINWKGFVWLCLLVISTSALARGARLGEEKALKLPVSTLVTRFPL